MPNRTRSRGLVGCLAFVACASGFAAAQDDPTATVMLRHDDADGVIAIGESVTWTLDIAFSGAELLGQINMAIRGPRQLGATVDFEFGDGQSDSPFFRTNLNPNLSSSGFDSINLNNSLVLEAFGVGTASRDNPIRIGSFTFTALEPGELQYSFGTGRSEIDFIRLERSPTEWVPFATAQDVTIVTDSLSIVPVPASVLPLTLAGMLATRHRRPTSERSPA